MVIIEKAQLQKVAELTVVISLSYFKHMIVAREATGIAMTAVLTLFISGSTPTKWKRVQNNIGTINKRIATAE